MPLTPLLSLGQVLKGKVDSDRVTQSRSEFVYLATAYGLLCPTEFDYW